MSAFISPIRQPVPPNTHGHLGKMRVAQQKSDDIIQKFRDTGDSEVADILLARYEELKKRSSNLSKEFAKGRETTTTGSEESADKPEQTDSFEINLEHVEDGSLKFTMPPDEIHGNPQVYILSSPNFDEKDPVHNIIITAEEMVDTAINYIDRLQDMTESEMIYLTDMCESLTSQKQKINSLEKAGTAGSPVALEVAADIYLNDAFRFLRSVQMIANVDWDELHINRKNETGGRGEEESCLGLSDLVLKLEY